VKSGVGRRLAMKVNAVHDGWQYATDIICHYF